ncbi:MAG TPA: NAD(P)-dependent oxidoreductase, partial [Prolixibacteraceae bacterium]|nr:NAD(P)-dependent oxidoreductase [Prolixibacteraceae bacterium]
QKTETIREMGAFPLWGDIRDPHSFRNELPPKLDRIVLLSMPSVTPGKRITQKRKQELRDETNAFFSNALQLAIDFHASLVLPGGTSFRTNDLHVADESWPILREGITEIGADTDALVEKAFQNNEPPVVQLLFGKIYGNGGLFRFQYNMVANGRAKILGKGNNFMPNIHASDAARAVVAAIEKMPAGQRFIVADDTPVTQGDFVRYMTKIMKQKAPGHIPAFIIRLVMGKDLLSVVNMDCKVSNEKAKNVLGWKPEYPSYKEGLEATLPTMKQGRNIFGT